MKRCFGFLALSFLFATCLRAQEPTNADLFVGYSYLRANPARNAGSFSNDGGVGALSVNVNDNFGIEFEFGGYYNGDVNKRSVRAKSMTFLFGPRLSVGRSRDIDPYVHVLFGAIDVSGNTVGVVNGANSGVAGTSISISEHNFAMAAGGGLDVHLTKFLLCRPIQLDYLLTRLEDPGFSGQPTQNRNQHNFRVSAGLVFQFGGRVK